MVWGKWISICVRINLTSHCIPHTKINLKWIKYKTVKLLEENMEENLYDNGCDSDFLDMTQQAQEESKTTTGKHTCIQKNQDALCTGTNSL